MPNCFKNVLFDFKIFVDWCGCSEMVDKIFAEDCSLGGALIRALLISLALSNSFL